MDSAPLGCSGPSQSRIKQSTKFELIECEHRQLLQEFMSAIYEYILVSSHESATQAAITTDKYYSSATNSLLIHINNVLELIFVNGLRIVKPDVGGHLLIFLQLSNEQT